MRKIPLHTRFYSKTRLNRATGCIEWTASKNSKGYGRIQMGGIVGTQFAHRISYEMHIGKIPEGLLVLHRCDNPSCVNPDHLWLGTTKNNAEDCVEKGRRPRGEDNRQATHTAAQVAAISADYLAGCTIEEICARYGVKHSFIADIVRSRTWKHVIADKEALKDAAKQRRKTNAHLTAKTVAEIRARLAAGETGVALATVYGVHKATISDIKLRKIWADVA